jgi:hypothetical protein
MSFQVEPKRFLAVRHSQMEIAEAVAPISALMERVVAREGICPSLSKEET